MWTLNHLILESQTELSQVCHELETYEEMNAVATYLNISMTELTTALECAVIVCPTDSMVVPCLFMAERSRPSHEEG